MFERIVVALDDTTRGETVLAALQTLSLGDRHRVILTHVIDPVWHPKDAREARPLMDTDPAQAAARLRTYQEQIPCPSQVEVLQGDTVEEILRLVSLHGADLVILGNRGLHGVERILKGSISGEMVGSAPCSVLVVKDPEG